MKTTLSLKVPIGNNKEVGLIYFKCPMSFNHYEWLWQQLQGLYCCFIVVLLVLVGDWWVISANRPLGNHSPMVSVLLSSQTRTQLSHNSKLLKYIKNAQPQFSWMLLWLMSVQHYSKLPFYSILKILKCNWKYVIIKEEPDHWQYCATSTEERHSLKEMHHTKFMKKSLSWAAFGHRQSLW